MFGFLPQALLSNAQAANAAVFLSYGASVAHTLCFAMQLAGNMWLLHEAEIRECIESFVVEGLCTLCDSPAGAISVLLAGCIATALFAWCFDFKEHCIGSITVATGSTFGFDSLKPTELTQQMFAGNNHRLWLQSRKWHKPGSFGRSCAQIRRAFNAICCWRTSGKKCFAIHALVLVLLLPCHVLMTAVARYTIPPVVECQLYAQAKKSWTESAKQGLATGLTYTQQGLEVVKNKVGGPSGNSPGMASTTGTHSTGHATTTPAGAQPGYSAGGQPGYNAGGQPGAQPGFTAGGQPGYNAGGQAEYNSGGQAGAQPGYNAGPNTKY